MKNLKQARRLTRDLKIAVSAYGLNPKDYMLQEDGDAYVTIVHKATLKTRRIDKYAKPKKGVR